VRALRNLHTALRPQGILLDVHPEPENTTVEIRRADQTINLGQIDQSQDRDEINVARAALRQTLTEGLFVLEDERSFDFVSHFDSVEDWLAWREKRQSSGVIAEDVIARGRALLAQAPGELLVHRRIHAARYRRT
jgi:hypothetical protein